MRAVNTALLLRGEGDPVSVGGWAWDAQAFSSCRGNSLFSGSRLFHCLEHSSPGCLYLRVLSPAPHSMPCPPGPLPPPTQEHLPPSLATALGPRALCPGPIPITSGLQSAPASSPPPPSTPGPSRQWPEGGHQQGTSFPPSRSQKPSLQPTGPHHLPGPPSAPVSSCPPLCPPSLLAGSRAL